MYNIILSIGELLSEIEYLLQDVEEISPELEFEIVSTTRSL